MHTEAEIGGMGHSQRSQQPPKVGQAHGSSKRRNPTFFPPCYCSAWEPGTKSWPPTAGLAKVHEKLGHEIAESLASWPHPGMRLRKHKSLRYLEVHQPVFGEMVAAGCPPTCLPKNRRRDLGRKSKEHNPNPTITLKCMMRNVTRGS